MNRQQAEIILAILTIVQDDWDSIAYAMEDRGLEPKEIINAWKALEKLAGSKGTAPQLSDFR